MSVEKALQQRSGNQCELCGSSDDLSVYEIPSDSATSETNSLLVCSTCLSQINDPASMDVNHWRCLNDSMWSQVEPVQVMSWVMLNRLSSESWAQDLLDMMYLEDEALAWAQSVDGTADDDDYAPTLDSNGAVLNDGDTVTLIKDLVVKGAGFTAKRGTAVRNISLTSNPEQIEGRVNGTRIVLLTKFLKKSS